MATEYVPCCAADALRRIRQVPVNGIMMGITMLEESIAAIRNQNLSGETEIRAALMKKVKVCNSIPPGVEEAYAAAMMEEDQKSGREE